MIFPIRTDSPLRTTPYMNWAIIAANVVAYLAQQARPTLDDQFALFPHDPWLPAFVSYAFLHGSPMHIVMNMLFLYIFGNNVNDKMGHSGYLAFYLAGAVFSGVGFVAVASGTAPVVGASGAVAAVTGAYLVLFPSATVTLVYLFFFIGTFELSSFWFVALFLGWNLIGLSGHAGAGVAYSAHVFGLVFGFGLCFALLGAYLLPRDQFDVLALVRQWNRRRQYRDVISQGYNPFDYTAGSRLRGAAGGGAAAPSPLDPAAARSAELRAAVADALSRHDTDTAAARFLELRAHDPKQVLPRQAQLDVATHLAAQQRYSEAAEAYEQFLAQYPKYEQLEQVQLMLGIIYARYLGQYARAKQQLQAAQPRLFSERELELARTELARIEPMAAAPPAA
jgi:membrane associated rhomboid family serine protease